MRERRYAPIIVLALTVALCGSDLADLRSRAEQGDADAQFELGSMYYWGEGVPADNAESVRWYQLAAEQGHTRAQLILGLRSSDDAESARWYRAAADRGSRMPSSCLASSTPQAEAYLPMTPRRRSGMARPPSRAM